MGESAPLPETPHLAVRQLDSSEGGSSEEKGTLNPSSAATSPSQHLDRGGGR